MSRLLAVAFDLVVMVGLFVFVVAMAGTIEFENGLAVHLPVGPAMLWVVAVLLQPFLTHVLTGRTLGTAALGLRGR